MKVCMRIGQGLLVGGWCAMAQGGSVNSVEIIAAAGQTPPGAPVGSTIASLNSPFADGNGKVGFTGNLSPSNNFVWYDTGITWLNSDGLPDVITGAEGTMGVSNNGAFIYSPAVNGGDAVWGSDGLILADGQPAPEYPGQFSSFNSRPTMVPQGVAHWVGGITATVGGATQQRALYRRMADSGAIVALLKTGDVVGGLTIASPSGIEFDYDLSDNLKHHIHALDTTAATTADAIVYLDGAIALREGDPTVPAGELWAAFDIVSVNDAGNYIVTGDTNGATATDEFIAYNGSIIVREGNTLDGVLLASGSTLRAASIDNNNRVVHSWGVPTAEVLFVGDGPTLDTSSVRLLGTGDIIDTNGDEIPDSTIVDFEASTVIGPGLSLSDQDFVYLEVTLLDEVNPEFEAIIRVPLPGGSTPCPADVAPSGGNGVVDVDDLITIINSWGPCEKGSECPADITGNKEVDVDDLLEVINSWGDC